MASLINAPMLARSMVLIAGRLARRMAISWSGTLSAIRATV